MLAKASRRTSNLEANKYFYVNFSIVLQRNNLFRPTYFYYMSLEKLDIISSKPPSVLDGKLEFNGAKKDQNVYIRHGNFLTARSCLVLDAFENLKRVEVLKL